ncbi:hypothetical protein BDB01DRAFT_847499 [Pilobolus umbonatus]|nr:hypothetical protein BDB01DRAFT_847499 [Pilobolus umbonatus]
MLFVISDEYEHIAQELWRELLEASGNYSKFTKRQLNSTIFNTAIIQYYNRGSPNSRQNITLDNINIAA